MPNLYVQTLGCKTNHYESQALTQQLTNHKFNVVETMEEADVGILNTCTVTGAAGRKSRQYLRRMKKQNPQALVVAMGCYAQLADVSEVCDLAIGTSQRNTALDRILLELNKNQMLDNSTNHDFKIKLESDLKPLARISTETEYEELGIVSSQEDTRAQIKIQDGCNEFCTYCAIPLARGRVRSRLRENIIKEAEELVKNGHQEVVLTGIHICSFEREIGRNSDALAELCVELNRVSGLKRIRLGSLEPLSVTKSFLEILKKADKVCPHFHLSLQSGSDSVLKRMRRRYKTDQYRECVKLLREIYNDPAITTDILVGFPEETEREFEESISFVKEINFSRIHVFPYSIRPGTLAAKMKQISGNTTKIRARKMLDLADELASNYAKSFLGKQVEVLLEDEYKGYMRGYSEQYVRTYFDNEYSKSGELKNILVTDVKNEELFGKIV